MNNRGHDALGRCITHTNHEYRRWPFPHTIAHNFSEINAFPIPHGTTHSFILLQNLVQYPIQVDLGGIRFTS